jgi:hemerythrin-like metal-binding protein
MSAPKNLKNPHSRTLEGCSCVTGAPAIWSDDLSIGIEMFDEEHKKLLEIIAGLWAAIGNGIEEAVLRKFVDDLIEYTFMHFRHEEMYFADCHYPRAEEHTRQHAEMRQIVLSFRERLTNEPSAALALEMLEFLRNWLSTHIKGEDKRFGAYLVARTSRP